jgi:hypothetical protein
MTKKKTALRQITQPDGTSEVQYLDGSRDLYDAQGKLIIDVIPISETRIEAWRKMPKDQALKESLALLEIFNSKELTVAEARFKLDVVKFISELQGAHIPSTQIQNFVAIKITVADLPPGMKIIDTTVAHKEQ